MPTNIDDEVIDINVDELFEDDTTEETETSSAEEKETTEGVARRINEVRRKTETDTKNSIAKDFGFDSYDEFLKAKDKQTMEKAGLDEDTQTLIDKLVDEKIARDPRMKRLEEIENKEKERFVEKQLSEINKLGYNFKDISQLPKDTLDMWEKIGDLKKAFVATNADEILSKKQTNNFDKGSTNHLASPSGANPVKTRGLTEEEKNVWRMVFPDMSDEELNKKTIEDK